jgi:hypothetical protein
MMAVKENPALLDTDDVATKEYTLVIDGTIEIESDVDKKAFFDGLFDAIIDYMESHNALAALTISHKEYTDQNSEHGQNGRIAP